MGLFDDLVPAPTPSPAPGEPITPPAQAAPELEAPATPAPASAGLFSDLAPGQNVPPESPDAYYQRTGRIRVTPRGVDDPNLLPKEPDDSYQPQGPRMEPVGGVPAFGIGAANGLTFNFADELQGISNAGLEALPERARTPALVSTLEGMGIPQILGLARLGKELLTGEDGPASRAYRDARNRWRDATRQAEFERPGATLAGNVTGALAAPGMSAAAPVRAGAGAVRQLGTRMLRSSATGAVQGGVSGVGEGETAGERATKGATGTTIGALIGGAVPVVAEPIIRAGGAVLRGGRRALNSLVNPTSEAERVVGETVTDTQRRLAQGRGTTAGLTERQFADAEARGQPVANVDLGGRAGGRLGRNAKNTPNADEAVDALEGMTEPRFNSQGPRIAGLVYDLVYGGANGRRPVDYDRLRELARSANAPAYRQAHADARIVENANPKGIWSDELARLSRSPTIREAMLSIGKSEGDRSIIEGFNAARKNPFVIDEKGRLVFRDKVNETTGKVTSTGKGRLECLGLGAAPAARPRDVGAHERQSLASAPVRHFARLAPDRARPHCAVVRHRARHGLSRLPRARRIRGRRELRRHDREGPRRRRAPAHDPQHDARRSRSVHARLHDAFDR
jgi:hypothetical protein